MAASENVHMRYLPPVDPIIDLYLADIGLGFNPADMRRCMRREVLKLSALSDAQLALLGIERGDIAAHAFRRLFPQYAPAYRYAA